MTTDRTSLVTFVFVYSILAVLLVLAVRRVSQIARRAIKPPPALETETEYPLDSDFWPWYNALLAQGDFSYAEAKAWYALRDHADVALLVGERTSAETDTTL